jgi:hypothetical protein
MEIFFHMMHLFLDWIADTDTLAQSTLDMMSSFLSETAMSVFGVR